MALPPTPVEPQALSISVDSSAMDVKTFVRQAILKYKPELKEPEIKALMKNIKGTGEIALAYTKEDWEKDIPGWGASIYISVQNSQKYVMDKFFHFALGIQALLLLISGGGGILQLLQNEDSQTARTMGIIFVVWTFGVRVLQAVGVSRWAHGSQSWPKFFRLKRTGPGEQSWWKDFAGFPK